jgi:hypothetical protein
LSQRCVLLEMARDEAAEARGAAEGGGCKDGGAEEPGLGGRGRNPVVVDAGDVAVENAKNAIVPKAQVGPGGFKCVPLPSHR